MKRIVVGNCADRNRYALQDPDATDEGNFESVVQASLTCLYPNYTCVRFSGSFQHDDRICKPDLALVAKNYSHWFIIEVELGSHSFDLHVCPQVTAFRYGEPLEDCVGILARTLSLSKEEASTFLRYVPRAVVVVVNKQTDWEPKLAVINVQLLSLSLFKSACGTHAVELSGDLHVSRENIGFCKYSAVDRSLSFPASIALPCGEVNILDPDGNPGLWLVSRDNNRCWITKSIGRPNIADQSFVQMIRSFDGMLVLRRTT